MDGRTVTDIWDRECNGGRCAGEPPLEFAREMAAELEKRQEIRRSRGCALGEATITTTRVAKDGLAIAELGMNCYTGCHDRVF